LTWVAWIAYFSPLILQFPAAFLRSDFAIMLLSLIDCRDSIRVARPLLVMAAAFTLLFGFSTSFAARSHAQAPWSGWLGEGDPVGSAKWWKKHKSKAVFHQGQGYSVEGVDGFFDGMGRPIDRAVTTTNAAPSNSEVDMEKGLAPALDPRAVYGKVKSAVGLGPNDEIAHKMFMDGERLFEQQRYNVAAEAYASAADRAVDMRIREDSLFMLGECYYFDDRCIPARDAYNMLADKFPSTRYLDKLVEREWAIARYLEAHANSHYDAPMTPNAWDKTRPWFDTMGHAIKTYENIRMNDPTGPRADDAIMAAAGVYFRNRKYEDADYHYELLRKEYPRSEFQFEAHLLGLRSKLLKYQGSDYDGTPLEESQVLVKQLRTNFAGQLSAEERDRLQTVSAQLHQELASRDMQMAQFYDGTKNYGSAKTYYAEVINKYPESELAQTAKDRMLAMDSLPDFPEKRLAWFVDIFPESQEHAALANVPEIRDGTLLAQPPSDTTTR
jgi:TolA-binding protein